MKYFLKIPFEKCPECGKKFEKRCKLCKECDNKISLPEKPALRKLKVERLIKKQMRKNHNFKSSIQCLVCGKKLKISENEPYRFYCSCGYKYP